MPLILKKRKLKSKMMFVFGNLAKKLQNGEKLYNRIAKQILSKREVKGYIITLIQERLYNQGTTSDNTKLRTDFAKGSYFYSDKTLSIKNTKGERTQNVTLNDTNEFYESFKIEASREFYDIIADFQKESGHISENFSRQFNSDEDFEQVILDMNEDEYNEFLERVFKPQFVQILKSYV